MAVGEVVAGADQAAQAQVGVVLTHIGIDVVEGQRTAAVKAPGVADHFGEACRSGRR